VDTLDPFVGEWSIEVGFAEAPPGGGARMWFEWLGEKFLVQRWEVPVPEAPDGIAVIGYDEKAGHYRQHYFDSRGVARVYEMTLEGGEWKLWRDAPGFSQRFTGTFSGDGQTISGAWEINTDDATWEKDFDITYRRIG
jgi:hypothetical protein